MKKYCKHLVLFRIELELVKNAQGINYNYFATLQIEFHVVYSVTYLNSFISVI